MILSRLIDGRLALIKEQLKNVKRVIAVAGAKGGVGKSSVATGLALILSRAGQRIGLLDLDLSGPSTHLILGLSKKIFPEEDKGIIPPLINGIKFMSVVYYSNDKPLSLRGIDISNVIIELLTITRWTGLDFLIIDLPPGINDTALDVMRLIKKIEFLMVTSNSKLALETTKKNIEMLRDFKMPVLGVIENMSRDKMIKKRRFGRSFCGQIAYDAYLEKTFGRPKKLIKTKFIRDLRRVVQKICF